MIARDALVLTATERVQILCIHIIDDGADFLSVVVNGARPLVWGRDSYDLPLRREKHETSVDKDVRVLRMTHDHETEVLVVIGFPKLSRDPQVVVTIVRHELVATDLVPLFRCFDSRRSQGVDAQTDRRAPRHRILDEFHLLAVVSKEKRARAFQTLFGDDLLVGIDLEVSADGAIGPNHANDVGAGLVTKTEVQQRTGNRLFLDQQSGTDLHLAADAERVDALIAGGMHSARAYDLPVIIFRAVIDCFNRTVTGIDPQQI